MTVKESTQLKALLLMIVFSMNTVIGFACAIGVDMGFNSHHHEENAIEAPENHHHDKSHHHEEADVHHHTSNNEKDNCCNGGVMKFQQVDKALASNVTLNSPLDFMALHVSFFYNDISSSHNRVSTIKYFVRQHHPPIPDVRIAIQSFQI